jgi:hypothetical protein
MSPEALRYEIAAERLILAFLRLQLLILKYDRNQPRAPAGCSEGGQWVCEGGTGGGISLLKPNRTEAHNEAHKIVHPIGPLADFPETGQHKWRRWNDDVFTDAAKNFNTVNGYLPSDPRYVSPGFIKSWAMVESGGSSKAFLTDPLQVNNPKDWTSDKANIAGLTGPDQTMTPAISAAAALKWLQHKGTNRDGTYKGRYFALRDYNGNRKIKSSYAAEVMFRTIINFGVAK